MKSPPDFPELTLNSRQPLPIAIWAIMAYCLHRIESARAVLITNPADPEAIHDFRVNIRQLRSFISFIKPLLKPEGYPQVQSDLRQLAQDFGYVREIDTLRESWQSFIADHPVVLLGRTIMDQTLLNQRQAELADPINRLTSETCQGVLSRTESWLQSAFPAGEQQIFNYLEDFAAYRSKQQLKKINRGLKECDFSNRSQVHPLRIRVKKLRYSFSLLEPLLKHKYRQLIPQLKDLQQKLGQICDAPRNMVILQEISNRHDNSVLYYESGLLIGFQLRTWEVVADKLQGIQLKVD